MVYYYIIPTYLTLIFIASYWVVNALLFVFDLLNFFWDWWDGLRRVIPLLWIGEYGILAGFVYYIVKWELSGTP